MATYYITRYSGLAFIVVLALMLGITNGHPENIDVSKIETQSPAASVKPEVSKIKSQSPAASVKAENSDDNIDDASQPGQCNSGEVLQYSECQCNNVMTSYCWSPATSFWGHTNVYGAGCPIGTQCVPSIVNSWTASCLQPAEFTMWTVSGGYDCNILTFTAYGSTQVVTQILGPCPPDSNTVPFATYYFGQTDQFSKVNPTHNYWLSAPFNAGKPVQECISTTVNDLSVVSAFTGTLSNQCTWCG